jgi:alpha-N-arabinofuranosidase
MAMYANLLESRVGKCAVDASQYGGGKNPIAVIDAVATVDESGKKWSVALVNRHPEQTADCTVKLGERLLDGTFDATILDGDSPDAFNDVEHPNRIVPQKTQLKFENGVVKLPPHSLAIIHIQ